VKEIIRKERKKTNQETKILQSQLKNGAGFFNASSSNKNNNNSNNNTFPSLNLKGKNLYLLDNNNKQVSDLNMNEIEKV
jgi:hypothetical protein